LINSKTKAVYLEDKLYIHNITLLSRNISYSSGCVNFYGQCKYTFRNGKSAYINYKHFHH